MTDFQTDVTVTQADKLAAEAFWQEYGPFRMGTVSALAAAFARRRIAALADAQGEAVEILRDLYDAGWDAHRLGSPYNETFYNAATAALAALKGE